eukprot:1384237-Pleurochrysis_carterae.AAC.2
MHWLPNAKGSTRRNKLHTRERRTTGVDAKEEQRLSCQQSPTQECDHTKARRALSLCCLVFSPRGLSSRTARTWVAIKDVRPEQSREMARWDRDVESENGKYAAHTLVSAGRFKQSGAALGKFEPNVLIEGSSQKAGAKNR